MQGAITNNQTTHNLLSWNTHFAPPKVGILGLATAFFSLSLIFSKNDIAQI